MFKSNYSIPQMDCPSEENLIRMKLQDDESITGLAFNFDERSLTVFHNGDAGPITAALKSLNLGARHIDTSDTDGSAVDEDPIRQRKVLRTVLAVNFAFFLIEILSGILSGSMGLVADSLDMLADALVYGMSLLVVGVVIARKKRVARFCGYVQIALALLGLSEIIRRFIGVEEMPDFQSMIGISLLALVANTFCLWILRQMKSRDAHIRASVIFSANDVIINLGVITAGLLVWWLENGIPDLVVGIVVFAIVIRGAIRILELSTSK